MISNPKYSNTQRVLTIKHTIPSRQKKDRHINKKAELQRFGEIRISGKWHLCSSTQNNFQL